MTILESVQSTIEAVVGRCYPMTVPDRPTLPYSIYLQVSNSPEVNMANSVPIENTRIQIDVFSTTYAEVQSLADAVRVAMMGLGGIPQTSGDIYESAVKSYRVTQDFSFWYKKVS
jgi:Protein of unknown function (DUF3168)